MTNQRFTSKFLAAFQPSIMMSGPITRETFILAEEAMKIATRLPTMWVIDGDDLKEVPVPSSVKETGTLPEGYTYGQGY